MDVTPQSGRRAQAARNDERILEAARDVFIANPAAPIADVAKRAGVGISALYRRYPSKDDLLRELCADGLRRYIAAAEAAAAGTGDAWASFERFMRDEVDANAASLTRRLAGTFEPTPELYELAEHAGRLNVELFERARAAGAVRAAAGVTALGFIFEQLAALRLGDAARPRGLRRRYLALFLDGLRARPGDQP